MSADGSIVFKDWLPDLPALGNTGLTEALNALPQNLTFKSFSPLQGSFSAFPYVPTSAYYSRQANRHYAYGYDNTTAGGNAGYFTSYESSAWTAKSGPGGSGVDGVDFVEYGELVIGAVGSQPIVCITAGSTGQFTALATSGDSPSGGVVGVIGQFIMAGAFPGGASGTTGSYVRWSSINAPRDWPTPNSSTAIARQSGEQYLDPLYGGVARIVGGDQYGLIFQAYGINRVTYIGGGAVFQFDNYEAERGAYFSRSVIQVSGLTYYLSDKGIFVTDGVSVRDIGTAKVTRTFLADVDFAYASNVRVAVDAAKNLIKWSYPNASATAGRANKLLIYNYAEDRWSLANQETYALFTGGDVVPSRTFPMAFGASRTLGSFSGAPGTAVFTTGELEAKPGAYARIKGVKPMVDVTINAITVALGARDDLTSSPTFTAETTANSRSGFADFRSEARYHRARLTIAGTFNSAQGLEYDITGSGQT